MKRLSNMTTTPRTRRKRTRRLPSKRGSTLSEFGKLSVAEQITLKACVQGEAANIGDDRPSESSDDKSIRGEFVRFLAMGADSAVQVYESGLEIVGAWIDGDVDLENCRIVVPLYLTRCTIDGDLALSDSALKGVDLEGSSVAAIFGDHLRCSGDLNLHKEFRASGEVRLLAAQIEGDLNCEAGSFEVQEGDAISADGASIGGNVWLSDGLDARGPVRLIGAYVNGDVYCSDCKIASSNNELRWEPALVCTRMSVRGALYLGPCQVSGIDLAAARVSIFAESLSNSEQCREKTQIVLDGFFFERFHDAMLTSSAARMAFLGMQRSEHLGQDFKPQPWEHLVKILRDTGHLEEARAVAIEKQKRLRRAHKITGLRKAMHIMYGWAYGYGYRPTRLAIGVVGAAVLFAGL